jgi:hypothetical protein
MRPGAAVLGHRDGQCYELLGSWRRGAVGDHRLAEIAGACEHSGIFSREPNGSRGSFEDLSVGHGCFLAEHRRFVWESFGSRWVASFRVIAAKKRSDAGTVLSRSAAEKLARRAHGNDRRKSGDLFIDHVRRVAAMVEHDPDPNAVPAALLHDAVEKGSADWKQLRSAGASDRLVEIIEALTERHGESQRSYLSRCAADPVALRIKRADLLDKIVDRSAQLDKAAHSKRKATAQRRLRLLERLAASQ